MRNANNKSLSRSNILRITSNQIQKTCLHLKCQDKKAYENKETDIDIY
jgi:hypothetical protein